MSKLNVKDEECSFEYKKIHFSGAENVNSPTGACSGKDRHCRMETIDTWHWRKMFTFENVQKLAIGSSKNLNLQCS